MDSNSTSYSRPFTLAPASISINGLRPLAILRHRPYTLNPTPFTVFRILTLQLLSNWGDFDAIGLSGIEIRLLDRSILEVRSDASGWGWLRAEG